MTLGIDSVGELTFTTNQSIVPVGTIKGVLIFVIDNNTTTDNVTGVTINGVAMTEIALSPYSPVITERAVIHGFFMGSSIPSGTLDVDFSGSIVQELTCYVAFTAAGDTEILDTSVATSGAGTNPTATVNGDAAGVYGVGAIQSNIGATSSIGPGGSYTEISEVDFGVQVGSVIYSTSLTTTTPTFGVAWSSGVSDDYMILAATVREVVALIEPVTQATETDLSQAIAWAPKHRLVNRVTESDFAQAIAATAPNLIPVVQAFETDTAQTLTALRSRAVAQATETDTAQALDTAKVRSIGQAAETDLAQAIDVLEAGTLVAQATETDLAQPIAVMPVIHQAIESERAQQVTALGGLVVISDAPVLIRAPGKAGRIFHEFIARSGEGFHPSVGEWQAEEDAPGGFRAAKGIIKHSDFRRHAEVFQDGSMWRTYLEDGTCISSGRLKQPDRSGSVVQLTAEGRAHIADREVGPILYQAHVGSEISEFFSDTDQWRVGMHTMSHSNVDSSILFERTPNVPAGQVLGGAHVIIPFFGRDLAYLRMRVQGVRGAFLSVQTSQRNRIPSTINSAELDVSGTQTENWFFNWETAQIAGNAAIDLTLSSGILSYPNSTEFTNEADPADVNIGFVWPDLIIIEVDDWSFTTDAHASEVILSNIEVNGAALGSSRSFSVGDLVEDIAARLGFRDVNVGGAYDITPYELPPGAPASEALDWACLLSGKRYRILDTGSRATFEFGSWSDHQWALASPWSPLRTIPEERYDSVSVPYSYPGTHGQLIDHVIPRVEDSPLARRRIFHGLALSEPAHNRDKALALGHEIADILVRPRFGGDFSAAEVIGDDGQKLSAHHINAGDVLNPWRGGEPGSLRIGRLTRFEDHVEGEFDGERKALVSLLARREKRLSNRKG